MAQRAVVLDESGTRVAWRTWQLVPEWLGRDSHRPLLTGLAGFPWRAPGADARCLNRDPATSAAGPFTRTVDRHHRRVPDPTCTCGIYAPLRDLGEPPQHVAPRHSPLVVGFVELGGRLVADGDAYRAQRAIIVGPLAVVPSRRPWWHRDATRPERVVVERHGYRVLWRPGRGGVPYGDWHAEMRHELAARYGVRVVADGGSGRLR